MPIKKDIVWRVGAIYFLVLVFAILIVGKVLYLQLIEGEKWHQKAKLSAYKSMTVPANRGDICASDGRLLSSSLPYYELRMDFQARGLTDSLFNANVDSLAFCLSRFFKDKSHGQYKRELLKAHNQKRANRYVLINSRKINYNELKTIQTFPLFRLSKNTGGLICKQDIRRIKPHLNLASRTIGYLIEEANGQIIGKVGIEGAYENELKGIDGISFMQKMSGHWLPVNQIEPKDGNDVITTIDVDFQDVAESALLQQLQKYNASHGTAVLMKVNTGEIKAIANLGKDTLNGGYREIYNYAVGETSEPGSTFKLASIIALLEDGYIKITDSVNTGHGTYTYYDQVMRDSDRKGHGKITVKEAFEKSSNVGISRLVYEHYSKQPSRFIKRLYSLHLNDPLGIKIKGEGIPHIKYPDDPTWSGITLPWMSIGYEVQQTPLQTLTLYNAIANNGKMLKPRFIKELQYHGETVKTFDTKVIESMICSKKTLKLVKEMLEGVVDQGTAKNIRNQNYRIAGKTGTALIADKNRGYSHRVYQASFVGYFPAEKPEYSCIVVISSPNKHIGFYGNQVAGPVFKAISDKVYAMSHSVRFAKEQEQPYHKATVPISMNGNKMDLNIVFNALNVNVANKNTNAEWVITSRKDSIIQYKHKRIKHFQVPNVKGMGLKDALYILENAGLKVSVQGIGIVIDQSLKPGSHLRKGEKIVLKLA